MKILVTADIHGNLEALTAVLTAAEGQFDGFISLGDMVGYGPDPEACVQCLRQLKKSWTSAYSLPETMKPLW
ncbi:MAG: metallophosphoesterase family protein [Treponema sp.]